MEADTEQNCTAQTLYSTINRQMSLISNDSNRFISNFKETNIFLMNRFIEYVTVLR